MSYGLLLTVSVLLGAAWLRGLCLVAHRRGKHLRIRQQHHAVPRVESQVGNSYLGHGAFELAAEGPRAQQYLIAMRRLRDQGKKT